VKIPLIVLGSLAGLVVVLIVAGLMVIQTAWFRDLVRDRIVTEVEKSTGGKVEIARFEFDWKNLRAVVRNFVLHGTEGPAEPALFRAQSIEVVLKVVSVFKRQVDIQSLTVERPQGYVRVAADGFTNLPTPKVKQKSERDPIETILDLAIRRFTIRNGELQFAQRRIPVDVRGEKLRARLDYDTLGPRYAGNVAMTPVYVRSGKNPPLPVNTDIGLKIEKGRVEITRGAFRTAQSRLELAGAVMDLKNPRATVRQNGQVVLDEIARAFADKPVPALRRAPPVAVSAAASFANDRLDIAAAQIDAGRSRITASGAIDSIKQMTGAVRFDGNLSLTEAGRIMAVSARPEGVVKINGQARLAGRGQYSVAGRVAASDVAVNAGARRLTGIRVHTDVTATPDHVRLAGLRLDALGGAFAGEANLRNMDTFRLQGTLSGFELRELASDLGRRELAWDGTMSGPVAVSGRLKGGPVSRELVANAKVGIAPGKAGIPLSGRLDVTYDGPRDVLNLGNSFVQLPATRLDLAGSINQQLQVRLVSRDLNDFLPALALASPNPPKQLPVKLRNGEAVFDGTVRGRLTHPVITGRVSMARFAVNDQPFDRFSADLNAGRNGAAVRNAVLQRDKLSARVDASVGLRNWKPEPAQPVTAKASLRNANLRDILAAAGKPRTELSGDVTADAQVSGTVGDPRATAQLSIEKVLGYDARANANYGGNELSANIGLSGPKNARIELAANYRHLPKQYGVGRVRFQLNSAALRLENIKQIQERQPGLEGAVELHAKGDAAIDSRPGRPRILLSDLNAALRANALEVGTKRVGNLTATAQTSGQNLVVDFKSDLAQSNINGRATWLLAGDYPVKADINFDPVRIAAVRNVISPARPGQTAVDGLIAGRASVSGPSTKPDRLKGFLELTQLELKGPEAERAGQKSGGLALKNTAPVRLALDSSTIRIQQARFSGPATDIALEGAVYLKRAQMLELNVNGTLGLEVLERFNRSVYSAGAATVKAAIRGNMSHPLLDGRLEFKNASLNLIDMPNGISNANGIVLFNGEQAVIQSFTGESGGGKVKLAGFVRYAGEDSLFRVQANVSKVRVRFPPHASTVVDAALDLNGTAKDSQLTGTVTVQETAYYSNTDFGSMLSQAGTPPRTPSAQTGMLARMKLDIRVQTAPTAQFQTTLAQNLKADMDVEVRGTAAKPGLVGRIVVSQGEIVFFGAKYNINHATVSFYNPQRIEPVVNVDLETEARSVKVYLSVTGPMDQLKLAYRSDPPLPFSDIVSLLATGKAPTTDPVLAAKEPAAPEQSWQQMGASTLLGQAVANPVSGRLQRLFGVTKLKIDPKITGAENTPQARLTMEQQITRDLTFTYIQDVTASNPQVLRVEWAIDPTWSAVALRQENGQFGIDFYYKKGIR
jgi:translocation and assembly module TamB